MLNVVVGYRLCMNIFKLMQLVIKPQIVPMIKAMANKKLSNDVRSLPQKISIRQNQILGDDFSCANRDVIGVHQNEVFG
uniref:Uncharacterized protein n=1 Tax=Romanomermis culicivorax TaxID=13658 RepID=A0A915JCW9_ROMCU